MSPTPISSLKDLSDDQLKKMSDMSIEELKQWKKFQRLITKEQKRRFNEGK